MPVEAAHRIGQLNRRATHDGQLIPVMRSGFSRTLQPVLVLRYGCIRSIRKVANPIDQNVITANREAKMGDLFEKIRNWLSLLQGIVWLVTIISTVSAFVLLVAWQWFVLPFFSRRTVYARAFVIEDSNGAKRAALGLAGDNSVALQLFDSDQKLRANLGLEATGDTMLHLSGANGERIELGVRDEGVALELFDAGGKNDGVKLAEDRNGSVVLGLGQLATGQFQVLVAEDPDKSGLTISDKAGKLLIGVEFVRDGEAEGIGEPTYKPMLEVWDAERKHVVWRAIKATPPSNQ